MVDFNNYDFTLLTIGRLRRAKISEVYRFIILNYKSEVAYSSITERIKALEKDGLITTTKVGVSKYITLTKEGLKAYHALREINNLKDEL